jgi:hypothetical protein
MFKKPGLSAALTILVAALVSSGKAGADERHDRPSSACRPTAATMLRACNYDVGDDLFTALANCNNITDSNDRRACQRGARAARRDDAAECIDVFRARRNACDLLGEDRYDPDPLLNPANEFIDPDDIPDSYAVNPYVSLAAGHTHVLRAEDEIVVVHATDESRDILGVACRVVVDIVVEADGDGLDTEYEAVEVTDDWFAQDVLGNVYYCGEVARNYEDGVLRDLDGSFEAGIEFAKSGELIRVAPVAGDAHRQEFALGEAEDIVQYLDTMASPSDDEGGENLAFPCNSGCLRTFDFAPIDPASTEYKYYLPGTGFVLAVGLEDGEITGEREELVCVGDSLDVLSDPGCGIDNAEALLEELCRLSPDAFCSDD